MHKAEWGERLRVVREVRRISQRELGQHINSDQSKISLLESGTANLNAQDLLTISRVLRFSLDAFCAEGFDISACLLREKAA